MYVTDLIYFVRDALNPDKTIKVINSGNRIRLRIKDKEEEEARREYVNEDRNKRQRRQEERIEHIEKEREEDIPVYPRPEEPRGFAKRQQDRAQVEEFLRRMEKGKVSKDTAKVKKITK